MTVYELSSHLKYKFCYENILFYFLNSILKVHKLLKIFKCFICVCICMSVCLSVFMYVFSKASAHICAILCIPNMGPWSSEMASDPLELESAGYYSKQIIHNVAH